MKTLIIGGTGNISSSIVQLLLQKGHDVTCYNRGNMGSPLFGTKHIQGDRNDRERFESTMCKQRFDVVIDMICFSKEDAESNLRAFPEVGHLIHISTTCVYGVHNDWLPVSEDHPLRPITDYGRNKAEAEQVYLAAHYQSSYPVTIVRPSTTYGPRIGMLRQITWDFSWIDRIRKGKPLIVSGDGKAIHQFLHVDDASDGIVGMIGNATCIGQIYNLTNRGFVTWEDHHRTAMKVLGREVELVGIPLNNLVLFDAGKFDICRTIFAHNCYYNSDKLFRDVPHFKPKVSLEKGMQFVIGAMDEQGRVPDSDLETWEDDLIARQRRV